MHVELIICYEDKTWDTQKYYVSDKYDDCEEDFLRRQAEDKFWSEYQKLEIKKPVAYIGLYNIRDM